MHWTNGDNPSVKVCVLRGGPLDGLAVPVPCGAECVRLPADPASLQAVGHGFLAFNPSIQYRLPHIVVYERHPASENDMTFRGYELWRF